jgi:plastocyanin
MFRFLKNRRNLAVLGAILLVLALVVPFSVVAADRSKVQQVTIPEEDRFIPFAMVIRAGDRVRWVNNDGDDHAVVSNDFFTTSDNKGTDALVVGTENNGGKPGVFSLRFRKVGVFVYYCHFHAVLDAEHQPIAPGPDGGIQDANGNFGTPMNGIIVVLPGNRQD